MQAVHVSVWLQSEAVDPLLDDPGGGTLGEDNPPIIWNSTVSYHLALYLNPTRPFLAQNRSGQVLLTRWFHIPAIRVGQGHWTLKNTFNKGSTFNVINPKGLIKALYFMIRPLRIPLITFLTLHVEDKP